MYLRLGVWDGFGFGLGWVIGRRRGRGKVGWFDGLKVF